MEIDIDSSYESLIRLSDAPDVKTYTTKTSTAGAGFPGRATTRKSADLARKHDMEVLDGCRAVRTGRHDDDRASTPEPEFKLREGGMIAWDIVRN